MKFETTYNKIFKIEFDSYGEKYIAYTQDGDVINESLDLDKLTKYLDDIYKGKKKVDIPFIYDVNKDTIEYGRITSIVRFYKKGGNSAEVWVHLGSRIFKENSSYLYADTFENRDKMKEIIEINKKIRTLDKERDEIYKSLTKLKLEDDKEALKC